MLCSYLLKVPTNINVTRLSAHADERTLDLPPTPLSLMKWVTSSDEWSWRRGAVSWTNGTWGCGSNRRCSQQAEQLPLIRAGGNPVTTEILNVIARWSCCIRPQHQSCLHRWRLRMALGSFQMAPGPSKKMQFSRVFRVASLGKSSGGGRKRRLRLPTRVAGGLNPATAALEAVGTGRKPLGRRGDTARGGTALSRPHPWSLCLQT